MEKEQYSLLSHLFVKPLSCSAIFTLSHFRAQPFSRSAVTKNSPSFDSDMERRMGLQHTWQSSTNVEPTASLQTSVEPNSQQ